MTFRCVRSCTLFLQLCVYWQQESETAHCITNQQESRLQVYLATNQGCVLHLQGCYMQILYVILFGLYSCCSTKIWEFTKRSFKRWPRWQAASGTSWVQKEKISISSAKGKLIGVSLSEPHTSEVVDCSHVCLYVLATYRKCFFLMCKLIDNLSFTYATFTAVKAAERLLAEWV